MCINNKNYLVIVGMEHILKENTNEVSLNG